MPFDRGTRSFNITLEDLCRHFTSDTGRTDNQSFMIFLQLLMIRSRTVIEAIHPGVTDKLDQVLIAKFVLGQHNQVIATQVLLGLLQVHVAPSGHIHLTSEDGLERLQSLFLASLVDTIAYIMEFLDAEHIAMVSDGHAFHAVGNSLVNQFLDTRLTVKNRIIGMYVQMYEIFHCFSVSFVFELQRYA